MGLGRPVLEQPQVLQAPLLLTNCVFQVNPQKRMAYMGDCKQMPWLPVLVVSGSEHLPHIAPSAQEVPMAAMVEVPVGAPVRAVSFTSHTALGPFLGL